MYVICRTGILLAFGVAIFTPSPALAADLGRSLKDGAFSAPVRSVAGPCYVRGDVGHSWSQDPSARYRGNPDPDLSDEILDNGWFAEIGAGCGSGSRGWRADVTLGLRQSRDFGGDVILPGPVASNLSSDIKSYTAMLNLYYDLGNLNGMVPYVGAGVGVAHHRLGDVEGDAGPTSQRGGDNTAFVWSLMAGVAYQLSERAILDIGYRFIDLGSVRSGSDPVLPRLDIDEMRAHEIKVGLRYHLGSNVVSLK